MARTAIIDIGSNSVRLVIYDGVEEIENIKVFAQLRRHLNANGMIDPKGVESLIKTLKEFSVVIGFYQVEHILCGATATVRQARNKKDIQLQVKKQTGLTIQIISEYEEAFYGCHAILNSSPLVDGYTIDLGGGSTEVTFVKNRKLVEYNSFPFGAVSLKQQFIKGNFPTLGEIQEISNFLQQQLTSIPWIKKNHYPIFAIGGSARNLVRAHQGLISYPLLGEHLYKMDLADLDHVQKHLCGGTFLDLLRVEGIVKGRADTIIPAIQVFIELGRLLDTKAFYLSKKGFRDGLVANNKTILPIGDIRKKSIRQLAPPSFLSKEAAQLCTQLNINDETYELLEYGLSLYNIGSKICSSDTLAHSFYLVANRALDGFTHKERVALALLASYHSKGRFKKHLEPYVPWFTKEERQQLQILGAIIKFVNAMDLQEKSVVEQIQLFENTADQLCLFLLMKNDFPHKKEELLKQKKHLERALKKDIHLEFSKI